VGRKPKATETVQAKRFAFILPGILAALAVVWVLEGHAARAVVAAVVGAAAFLCSLLAFALWMRFFRQWMKLAHVLGSIVTRLILSVLFFAVLTPLGWVMRLLGRAPLDLAWRDGKPTYWVDKAPVDPNLDRYRKLY
jgi:chromate transport protein ChrA